MADNSLTLNLTITATPAAPRIPLNIPKDVTPTNLRKLVSDATKIPLGSLRLIFRGRLIGNDENKEAVKEYKLEEGTVLHCMGKPEGGATTSAPSAAPAAASPATAGSSVTIQPPQATGAAAGTANAATSSNPLQASFATMRSSNPPQTYLTAVTTLEKILNNIVNNPMEEKYRKLKKSNAGFQKRLGGVSGGDAAMKAAGFVTETDNGEEVYIMHASAEKWPQLMSAKSSVEAAVQQAKAATTTSSAPPAGGGMPNFGGMPGMGGMGGMPGMGGMGPGMMGPDMQAAAARMMQDPNMLQNMLQNPMVQNMIRNDPRFANNPMMQQSMEQLASNPAMLQQISQMIRDPNMQQQMQQMQQLMRDPAMQQQMQQMMGAGGLGGLGGGMPGPFGGAGSGTSQAANSNGQQQQQQGGAGGSGGNDEAQTEEEMIAEAIRRSLEEGGS